MPKSTPAELAELREACFARDGGCKWPGHVDFGHIELDTLQMAHIVHRGMGGSKERNTLDGVVALCAFHHSIYDGRDGSSNVKRELAVMLKAQI